MKNIKKIITLGLAFILVVIASGIIEATAASGSAKLSYDGSSSVTVGSNITLQLKVSDIVGKPLAAIGGKVVFDKEYLQYVSSTGATSPYAFSINPANYKIAGLSFTGDGISSTQTIYTFVFKTLKTGTTSVTFTDIDLSDVDGNIPTGTASAKTITINEAQSQSNNAFLSALGVTGYNISPAFNKNTMDYSLSVPNNVTQVTITATKEDTKATISGTGNKSLNIGSNIVNIEVTAENGSKKTYKITINREAKVESNDNSLKSLSVSGYNLSPVFNKDTLKYSLTIPNDATEIIVNATKNSDSANIKITGNNNLKVGVNIVNIEVTAEDGSKQTYTIDVTRKEKEEAVEKDSDATLKSLYIGGYTLYPTFNKNVNVYSFKVGDKVGGLEVKAEPTSNKANVKVSGNLGWKYGVNQITIVVTAENGNKNTYIVNVTRIDPNNSETEKSTDNYLSSLTIGDKFLTPAFDKNISNYSVIVPYETDKLDISYKLNDSKAKVEVIGNNNLLVGEVNTIEIKVTAEDGSVRVYTINATRSAIASNTNLKSLSINGEQLIPTFNKNTLNYSVKVKSNVDYLDITALAESANSTIEIIGNRDFKVGNNVVIIKVTDENDFSKVYQIDVEKAEAAIVGMNIGQFIMFLCLGLGLLGSIILLLIILKGRNKNKGTPASSTPLPTGPVIDFKPEFNFGSRNGTDDDVVYPQGVLNQGNESIPETDKKLLEAEDVEEANFDIFDETVTKDELISAIREGMETKNTDKLKMLLKQEELNRLKKEIKEKEGSNYDEEDW